MHQKWNSAGSVPPDMNFLRKPLDNAGIDFEGEPVMPVPFSDCRIRSFSEEKPLTRMLHGLCPFSEVAAEGVIYQIIAFSYQLALECMDEDIISELESRKRILQEIKELSQ
jgi:hypothetical protein